jgi:hypothetical protein
MNDKGLELVLMVLFGGAGLILLIAGFALPYLATDRVLAVLGGALGLGFAAVQAVRLFRHRHAGDTAEVRVPAGEPR